MYSAFSEALRKILLTLSTALRNIASGGFSYLGTEGGESEDNELMVCYLHNNKRNQEPYKSFINSCYLEMLSPKQIQNLFNNIREFEKTKKSFEAYQDKKIPELFHVKNNITQKQEVLLIKDILANDKLLENLSAKNLRIIVNAINTIHVEQFQETEVSESANKENIIPFKKKDT